MEIDSTKQPDEKTILDTFGLEYSTLRETSRDGSKHEEMSFLEKQVINFDKVKSYYLSRLDKGPCKMPLSNDALFQIGDTWYFVEFKNGVIDIEENIGIVNKIYNSLFIFLEIINKHIDYSRNNIVYILVFNEDCLKKGITPNFKVNEYLKDKKKYESLRLVEENKLACDEINPSNYRAALFTSLQNIKFDSSSLTAQFDLARFERFIFKKVYTIPKYAFDNFFNRYILNK